MFIGHYAWAFASGKVNKSPSLALMFIAVQFLDLLWPILVLSGIETLQIDAGNTKMTHLDFVSYPYSHSLLMSLVWAVLFGSIYYLFTKRKRNALLLFALVFSHWILDFITHRPDLPLSPFGDTKVGLGLWNYPVLESILEIGLFVAGVILYFNTGRPKRKIAFWGLVILFLIIHIMNISGPPPPDSNVVAWSANGMWLFVIWAWWIEKPPRNKSLTN